MIQTGGRALPRLFRKLVLGIALAASPTAAVAAEPTIMEEDEALGEVDRAIGVMLDSMVERALAHRRDVSEVLAILLDNMSPLDATRSICETALSPVPDVRRVLCDALVRDESKKFVGRETALHHLMRDDNADVRHAAIRAARTK
jgi:hypothetical protein